MIKEYEEELAATLLQLTERHPPLKGMDYFIQLVKNHTHTLTKKNKKVIICGTSFPEAMVYGAGSVPIWNLGGSVAMTALADEELPRDTDPISRAMLGVFRCGVLGEPKNTLVIFPLINDSSRKIAYLLQRSGFVVLPVNIPPFKNQHTQPEWERQMEKCKAALQKHTKKWLLPWSMEQANWSVYQCKLEIKEILAITKKKPGLITGVQQMFLLNSYYYAENLEEWSGNLAGLRKELENLPGSQTPTRSGILLLGSPIYLPNYKIPFLIEEVGLHLAASVNYTTVGLLQGTAKADDSFFAKDASSAYTKNDEMLHYVSNLLSNQSFDGVVYHVLKGQIEHDFELEYFEKLFAQHNIPLLRLETDYNQQDIEQLRIRMEAFSEMIFQRQHRKERIAI